MHFVVCVPPEFWEGSPTDTVKKSYRFNLWRWQVPATEGTIARLICARFPPSAIKGTMCTTHTFVLFSTLCLEVEGQRQDVYELTKLLRGLQ